MVTQAARPREAALPEPRPDPARPRPLGEQVRRALGRGAQRAQARHRGGQTMEKVFEIYIKTTPERLWEAITDREMRREVQLRRRRRARTGRPARATRPSHPRRRHRDRRGREPRGRPAAPARAELHRAVERRREERGDLAGHLGDRAGRRLVPADRHPRPAARGRQRRALRRLADDPLRPQDAAGDRRAARPRPARCATRRRKSRRRAVQGPPAGPLGGAAPVSGRRKIEQAALTRPARARCAR